MIQEHDLYRRWLDELWNGHPSAAQQLVSADFVGHWLDELATIIGETQAMFTELSFTLEVGPIVEGDLVAGGWTGRGQTPDGPMSSFGNDILRVREGRFVEYWTASSAGS
jgi:hypothetical protein